MKFNISELKNLLNSVRCHSLQYISLKQDKFTLIISKQALNQETIPKNRSQLVTSTKSQLLNKMHPKQKDVKLASIKSTIIESEMYFTIVSPMVGTFYRSPAPNEPYFIELNEKVRVNQTVCLVEAMKLMNEIEAEVSGEIVEILVNDGDIIDCGQALMKIKPEK